MSGLEPPDDLADLRALSQRLGSDPALIQAAGGNTSVKAATVMWIKASGTLLAHALRDEIFVPVDLPAMQCAVRAGAAEADQPQDFALSGGLRPSIETCLHAVFAQRIVLHVHSVDAIAIAIRTDAEAVLAQRLGGFDWSFVPYVKPGAELAAGVARVLRPATDVVVLGNHGLIVAAGTVAEAGALLQRVVSALATASPVPSGPVAMDALAARAGDGFAAAPADHPAHQVALHPHMLDAAVNGSLYPDHVIFLGVGTTVLQDAETPQDAVARKVALGLPPPAFLVVPGQGVLMARGASQGAWAMLRCLGDVLTRLPAGVRTRALSVADDLALLNWDAEKYRLSLNAT